MQFLHDKHLQKVFDQCVDRIDNALESDDSINWAADNTYCHTYLEPVQGNEKLDEYLEFFRLGIEAEAHKLRTYYVNMGDFKFFINCRDPKVAADSLNYSCGRYILHTQMERATDTAQLLKDIVNHLKDEKGRSEIETDWYNRATEILKYKESCDGKSY